MKLHNITSPEDQKVTFIELFFDLVFVFSVTQIVTLFHHHLDLITVGQAILVFWLIWWAWTQFTWALNAADTTHQLVEVGVLVATGVAFFMAVTLPEAFHGSSLWFAVFYVLVRVIGLTLYVLAARDNPALRAAVRNFATLSIGGLAAVLIGGFLGGTLQYWFWGLAILLDVVAATVGGQIEGWNLHPEHFGERHGLFVIIALGETLIVTASLVTGAEWSTGLVLVAILAVVITCGLWWSYFPQAKPALDEALEATSGSKLTKMARDVYSLIHFPMLFGVIAYAVAIEESLAHPEEALSIEGRIALATGLLLFIGGMAVANWRASRRLLLPRIILIAATAIVIVIAAGLSAIFLLAIATIGILVIAIVEHRVSFPKEEAQLDIA